MKKDLLLLLTLVFSSKAHGFLPRSLRFVSVPLHATSPSSNNNNNEELYRELSIFMNINVTTSQSQNQNQSSIPQHYNMPQIRQTWCDEK